MCVSISVCVYLYGMCVCSMCVHICICMEYMYVWGRVCVYLECECIWSVSVCMCAYLYWIYIFNICIEFLSACLEYMCAGSCSCVWRPELTSGIISEDTVYLIFFETRCLTITWNLMIWLVWLASESLGPACLHSLSPEILDIHHHACAFSSLVLGAKTRSSWLHGKCSTGWAISPAPWSLSWHSWCLSMASVSQGMATIHLLWTGWQVLCEHWLWPLCLCLNVLCQAWFRESSLMGVPS